MKHPTVIAIDGPAGSGKSTTAKEVARRLRLAHLDTGALYRAVTLAAVRHGTDDPREILRLARELPVELALIDDGFRPRMSGQDVSVEVRSAAVTARVSEVSALRPVRDWANEELRDAAKRHPRGVVADGRDIGSVVFPDAALKVFLVASVEARARRRALQDGLDLDPQALGRLEQALLERDRADSSRELAPLTKPDDAVELDTSDLAFSEQVDRVVELAQKCLS